MYANYVLLFPESFSMSTMVLIPKRGTGSMTDVKHYRGIALSSLFCKLFDTCIIAKHYENLHSNSLQFAYKANTSTVQCVYSIIETISYYLDKKSKIFMCTLDASKAFDKVNLLVLFNKLYKKHLCPLTLRILMNSYCSQKMGIRWNGTYSDTFTICNGVKQGGVLSPLLFTIYLEELLVKLEAQGLGCHRNGMFVGAFIYADDITILAPTSTSLNKMLDTCKQYADDVNLTFNANKTKCMYFDYTGSTNIPNNVVFMHEPIEFVSKIQLLGINISTDIYDNRHISDTVRHFYCRTNDFFYFSSISCDIKSRLMSTYCLNLYGSTLWNYSKGRVNDMFVAWRKVVRKLWKLSNMTHCNLLSTINSSLPIEIALEKRCAKCIHSCLNSNNLIIKTTSISAITTHRSQFRDNY